MQFASRKGDGLKMSDRKIVARGTLQGDNIECPVVITAEYEKYCAGPIACKIIPDMEHFIQVKHNLANNMRSLSIVGKTDEGEQIFIPEFQIKSYTSYAGHGYSQENPKQIVWDTTVETFLEGQLSEFESNDERVICTLFISPLPIVDLAVRYLRYPDGQIKIENDQQRSGIKWLTPFGEAEFTEEYRYLMDVRVGVEPAITQIRRSCIKLSVNNTENIALGQLLIGMQEYFDDVLWFMSFLARQRIVWYEGEALYLSTKSSEYKRALIRRNKWLGHIDEQIRNHPLFDYDTLHDGLFEQLINRYLSSQLRNVIHQTIIHLLLSYERVYFENQYTSVYTGFEGLVYPVCL